MRSLSRSFVVAMLATALFMPHATPAAALSTKTGKVVAVNDGDTFDIDFNGDRVKDARVRMLGVQAMELKDYYKKTGECHGPEAYRRLRDLIMNKTVRVSAQNVGSTGLKGRIQRFVSVKIGGKWKDVGTILLKEGHALWFPSYDEPAKNVAYQRAARVAQARGRGLWDRDHCGRGPDQAMNLKMWVQWDADGVDNDNVNGEWIKIKNEGTRNANISNWYMRDSALRESHSPTAPLRQYRFPRGTVIAPNQSIYLHVGKGANHGNRYYWNQAEAIFENWESNGRNDGDGAYLFDPQGDIRFDYMYTCLKVRCADPMEGKLKISQVVYDPEKTDVPDNELIEISIPASSSATSVNLEGYLLESWPYSYAFDAGDVLAKGEKMVVVVGGDPSKSTRLLKFWGLPKIILDNPGGFARIRTFDNIQIDCASWGNGRC